LELRLHRYADGRIRTRNATEVVALELTIRAAHPALEMIDHADPGLAAGGSKLHRNLGNGKAAEGRIELVFRKARRPQRRGLLFDSIPHPRRPPLNALNEEELAFLRELAADEAK
jgi:hypothetical protein